MKIPNNIILIPLIFIFLSSCQKEAVNKDLKTYSPFEKGIRVIPEKVINEWGYETVDLNHGQYIKSTKNYGNSEEAFYARFSLGKVDYNTAEEASQQIIKMTQKRSEEYFGDKDYTRAIQNNKTLYYVSATSNYTYLEHQPNLSKKIQLYIDSK